MEDGGNDLIAKDPESTKLVSVELQFAENVFQGLSLLLSNLK